jgi:hypothetical protein
MAFDTVQGHVEAGRVQPRVRKSVDDLELAATWLEAYELDIDDPLNQEMAEQFATVAAWLRRMAEKRQ